MPGLDGLKNPTIGVDKTQLDELNKVIDGVEVYD